MPEKRAWRKLLKKLQRKRRRQKYASARDAEKSQKEADDKYQICLKQQETLAEFESKQAELAWLSREAIAQEQFKKDRVNSQVVETEQEQLRAREENHLEALKEVKYRLRVENDRVAEQTAEEFEATMQRLYEYLEDTSGGSPPAEMRRVLETKPNVRQCDFFMRTNGCRYGNGCQLNHRRPMLAKILVIHNFFQHPLIQLRNTQTPDAQLEFSEREMREDYDEFFYDAVEELQKFGKLINFRAVINTMPHLIGNVYVEYENERFAVRAFINLQGRYYASKPLNVEFSNLQNFRTAVCGLSLTRKCRKGNGCGFLHLFRNPENAFNTDLTQHPTPSVFHNQPPPSFIDQTPTARAPSWNDDREEVQSRTWRWSASPGGSRTPVRDPFNPFKVFVWEREPEIIELEPRPQNTESRAEQQHSRSHRRRHQRPKEQQDEHNNGQGEETSHSRSHRRRHHCTTTQSPEREPKRKNKESRKEQQDEHNNGQGEETSHSRSHRRRHHCTPTQSPEREPKRKKEEPRKEPQHAQNNPQLELKCHKIESRKEQQHSRSHRRSHHHPPKQSSEPKRNKIESTKKQQHEHGEETRHIRTHRRRYQRNEMEINKEQRDEHNNGHDVETRHSRCHRKKNYRTPPQSPKLELEPKRKQVESKQSSSSEMDRSKNSSSQEEPYQHKKFQREAFLRSRSQIRTRSQTPPLTPELLKKFSQTNNAKEKMRLEPEHSRSSVRIPEETRPSRSSSRRRSGTPPLTQELQRKLSKLAKEKVDCLEVVTKSIKYKKKTRKSRRRSGTPPLTQELKVKFKRISSRPK
ncbi:U2 small nuclear ribonucleoprotein auxiliary factor 35 kDa subunit-related protein 2 [Drosophila busckii]|uniref:U2 small nuclear ribonucleoprotein auxiliary factor 35 kDa subunit-related protein 2 n=1 Tax=Drosophila busckii TaxID=30019 RepID=UPI001432DA90|nr:U2 small nuclear ribonucleoprotein auxiliary factor 35 kDa subunit-related protein 2 [Drosophila busckii]